MMNNAPRSVRARRCMPAIGGRLKGPRLPGDDEVFIIPRGGKPHSFSIGRVNRADKPSGDGFPPIVHETQWAGKQAIDSAT